MQTEALLALYDIPDPHHPGRTLRGYDRDHARRTAAIVMAVAPQVGIGQEWMDRLRVIALLHDLGRTGMDPQLFGAIFQAAEKAGLPLRPPDLRARFPDVSGVEAVGRFIELARPALERQGIAITPRVRDHIAMRMDFQGRLRQMLRSNAKALHDAGVAVEPWMEKVVLYYYYPHLMEGEPPVVRRMGMVLVACENFEAFNNAERGRDYYGRASAMRPAFQTLKRFTERGLVDQDIIQALACVAASGALDGVVQEARGNPAGTPLPADERVLLQKVCADPRRTLEAGPPTR